MNDRTDGGDAAVALQQQSVLARFGELALRSNNPDEVLTEACRLVGEGLGTDLAKVMELQEDGTTLRVRAGVGWKPGVVGVITLKAVDGTSEGYALQTGEPMVSPDIETETRFSYPQFLIDHGVRAVANVVIIGSEGRQPFGILQIDSREPRAFTAKDTTFLRSYANLLAAAVDRLRVNGETRDGEERLRLALEAGELGSWELDIASGVATSTPRTLRIFGYAEPPPFWTYDVFISHVLAEDRAYVLAAFHEAVAVGMQWRFECRIHRAGDGEVRWIEAQGTTLGGEGNRPPTRRIGIVADITARKLAEQQLHQSRDALEERVTERTRELVDAHEKLRLAAEAHEQVEEELRQSSKMEAVGQLTGGLAHDFNNLLAAISGSLELIGTRVAQGRTAELGRYIEAARASADRAAALTHRLLAFSRRQTLDPRPTDLNQLVGGMEHLLVQTLGPSIQLDVAPAPGAWPALCDANQLESVLLNLVLNARDAMPDGGRLTLTTANAVLPDRRSPPREGPLLNVPPGDYVALSVTDTGSGMTPEVIARAFDPFFTTKPIGMGTGLGLSMTYGFVQQSGGYVQLQSQEGQGTTVVIYLPRHLGAVESVVTLDVAAGDAKGTASIVLLVVEDDPNVRMVVVNILSDLDYTVLEAVNGRSGLEIVKSAPRLDLLVTDVGLPGGMNGRQLADAARQQRPKLKVLFITGYAAGAAVSQSLHDDGMEVLIKPFKMAALAVKVQAMINA